MKKISNLKSQISNAQKGVVIVIILLIVAVSLAIALSVATRSVTDLSISNKIEDSSRAFFAAEAGLEKALKSGGTPVPALSFSDNSSQASVQFNPLSLPLQGQAVEFPQIGKEDVAQVWLANPQDLSSYYTYSDFFVYFGSLSLPTNTADYPAIKASVLLKRPAPDNTYYLKNYYFDSLSSRPSSSASGFKTIGDPNFDCTPTGLPVVGLYTTSSPSKKFYCQVHLGNSNCPGLDGYKENCADIPIIVRIRLLYSTPNQPIAVAPNASNVGFPPQLQIYTSTGTAGQVQRKIQLFKQDNVLPAFLDFALFSDGEISK